MSETAESRPTRWSKKGFPHSAAWLTGVLGICFALAAPFVGWKSGLQGLTELALAALVAWVPGLTALGVAVYFQRRNEPLLGMLMAMMLRMTPPLTICLGIALTGRGDELFGFVCYLLVFFLLSLATETYLSVEMLNAHAQRGEL